MVLYLEEESIVMPYLFTRNYDVELMGMNPHLFQVYIESHRKHGGERRVVLLRQNEKGLPLTLREHYGNGGHVTEETAAHDIKTVELELQGISRMSYNGAIVCVPMNPLTLELTNIERLSPKLAGYLNQRLASIGIEF